MVLLAGTLQIHFLLQIFKWEAHYGVVSKAENKFATLQCAPQALFRFLVFASEQCILLNRETFFSFLFRGGCGRQDGNGIKTHFLQE